MAPKNYSMQYLMNQNVHQENIKCQYNYITNLPCARKQHMFKKRERDCPEGVCIYISREMG